MFDLKFVVYNSSKCYFGQITLFVHCQYFVGSTFGAVSAAVIGRGVSLALSILPISPAASGAAIVLDLVSINYITVNLVNYAIDC